MRKLVNYSFNSATKQVTFTDFTSISIENVLLITVVSGTNQGLTIYQANDPAKGGTVSGNVLTLEYDTTGPSFSNTDKLQIFYEPAQDIVGLQFSDVQASAVPAPRGSKGLITTPAPQNLFRTTFASAIPSGVNTEFFTLVQSGTNQTVAQTGGNLVFTAGTTTNAETIVRSNQSFTGAMIARVQTILSQRITNNNFVVELVDVIGDGLALTINSATSITITIPNNPFTSANVGQSIIVGAVQSIAGAIPGRYAIASVSGNNVNFTVVGWPASGSGTCSLFGWNNYQLIYSGGSGTVAFYDAQRNGYNSGLTSATTLATTVGHLAILANSDGNAYFADQLVASATASQINQRASRATNLASETANLYLQLRVTNGSTAPASSTTWTIGSVSVENYTPIAVAINEVKPQGQAYQTPVAVTNIPAVTISSGTVTTVSTVTAANLAIPGTVADVASAAVTTTTTSATITPTAGISYSLNIPVTVVSGTNPTLDISVEESSDSGTNWYRVYDFPRITATGSYTSPIMQFRGNRIRYVQTVGGVSPSFTRAINRLQVSQPGEIIGQYIDRTINPNTLNSTSPVYLIDSMTDVSVTVRCSAQTTAATIAMEFSDDQINWFRHPKSLTTVNGFSTPLEAAPHWKFVRLIVTNAGSGITLGEAIIKAGGVSTVDLATESTSASIDSKLNTLGQKDMAGSMPVTIASNQSPIAVTGTLNANISTTTSSDVLGISVSGSRNNQIEINFTSAPGGTLITNTSSGGGSVSYANGHALYSTGAGVTASTRGVSVGKTQYRPAHEVYSFFTAAFTTPTSASSYQRIGLYDATNGFFIGYEGLTFGITKRTAGVDGFTAATAFNTDLLNGNASSKFTRNGVPEAINLTNSNLFRIRFAWLGSANILFDVFSPDGQWVTFHNIRQPNSALNPSVSDPNLPMTIDVSKSGADATDLIMYTACWAAGTTSNLEKISATLTQNTLALLTRSVITGETTAGGGGFVNVKVTPSGSLTVAVGDITGVVGQNTMANSLPVAIASNQSTLPVSAASLPLPAGAATSAIQTDGTQRTKITDGTNNVAVNSSDPTGTEQGLIVRNIPSGTQTVSGTVSVNTLPAGDNNIGNVDVVTLPAPLNVTGAGAAASALRVQLSDESLSALENINVTVSNSQVEVTNDSGNPIPVSGTVTANAGTGTFAVSAASLPLPADAATETTLSGLNTKVVTTANGIKVDGSAVTQPISGSVSISGTPSVSVSNFPATQAVSATDLDIRDLTASDVVTVTGGAGQTADVKVTLDGEQVSVSNFPAPLSVAGSGAAASSLRVQLADESLTALENITATVVNPVVAGETTYLKTSPVDTENDWITTKSWNVDTVIPTFNTRPAAGDFVALTGIHPSTQIIYQLPKFKTTPALNFTPHLWVDDGQEVYLIATTAVPAKTSTISGLDANSQYDGSAPLAITLNRYTPTIKVASAITANPATITYIVNGTSTATITAPAGGFNVGFKGGEQVRLTTTSQLPIGLAGTIASIDTSADTFTLNNVQFADGEEVRVNLTQLAATAIPPLGIAGLGRSSNIELDNGWFVLDAGYNLNLQPGDVVRFRSGPNSILPSLAGTAIATTTSYVITEVSGQKFKLTLATHGSATFNITAPGAGIFYVFKYPFIDFFAKGTDQLSLTSGGAAIDFKRLHDNAPITITPGTAATITQNSHPFVNGQEVLLTATTVPGGSFQGQKFYVKNAALNTYNLSIVAGGPAVAFTSAGTTVQIVDPIAGTATSVTVTTGTPASITLPAHWLGALSDFTLGGTTLPADYTPGKALYVVTPTTNTFTFSENKITPMVLADAGTAVTLSTVPGRNVDIMLERRTAYIANTPAPTDTTFSFAYTSGGSAITLIGGSGTQTFTAVEAPTIKAGSYIKVRAT